MYYKTSYKSAKGPSVASYPDLCLLDIKAILSISAKRPPVAPDPDLCLLDVHPSCRLAAVNNFTGMTGNYWFSSPRPQCQNEADAVECTVAGGMRDSVSQRLFGDNNFNPYWLDRDVRVTIRSEKGERSDNRGT